MAGNKNNYRQWVMLTLFLILVSAPFLIAYGAITQNPAAASEELVPCGTKANPTPCGYKAFLQMITFVFNYLLKFAVPLAAGVIVVGGAIMMTAGTNDSKRSQAKKVIWMAVWGLVIVLAAYLIVKLVFTTLVKPNVIPTNFK